MNMIDTLTKDADCVSRRLSQYDIVLQLAEEASELSAAASKCLRVSRGENPSPLSISQAADAMIEELADVMTVLLAGHYLEHADWQTGFVIHAAILKIMSYKMARWAARLEANEKGDSLDE